MLTGRRGARMTINCTTSTLLSTYHEQSSVIARTTSECELFYCFCHFYCWERSSSPALYCHCSASVTATTSMTRRTTRESPCDDVAMNYCAVPLSLSTSRWTFLRVARFLDFVYLSELCKLFLFFNVNKSSWIAFSIDLQLVLMLRWYQVIQKSSRNDSLSFFFTLTSMVSSRAECKHRSPDNGILVTHELFLCLPSRGILQWLAYKAEGWY